MVAKPLSVVGILLASSVIAAPLLALTLAAA
jgi:hypothetical protein